MLCILNCKHYGINFIIHVLLNFMEPFIEPYLSEVTDTAVSLRYSVGGSWGCLLVSIICKNHNNAECVGG